MALRVARALLHTTYDLLDRAQVYRDAFRAIDDHNTRVRAARIETYRTGSER